MVSRRHYATIPVFQRRSAKQAREVAGQLTDPDARKAVLELADSFDRLARAAANPAVLGRRELAMKGKEKTCDFSGGEQPGRP